MLRTASPLQIDESDEKNDTLAELIELHPQTHCAVPALPADAPNTLIDPDDKQFHRLISSADNGSAPGLSGWSYQMVRVLLADRDCRTGLATLIQDISNNAIHSQAKEYLLPSKLIALPKANCGIRPIGVGEVFYRIAALRANSLVIEQAAKILLPIQYGVGVSGGCQQVIHQLQHVLEQASDPVAALAVDFHNAFNTRHRGDILRALYTEEALRPIWKIADFAYSAPSPLYTLSNNKWTATLLSATGVRQGCPLSNLLYSVSVKKIYNDAIKDVPGVTAKAIQDDFTAVGPPEQLLKVLGKLLSVNSLSGLKIQAAKCQFIYFHNHTHPLTAEVVTQLSRHQIPIQDKCASVLGSVVGIDDTSIKQKLNNMVMKQKDIFNAILCPQMPVQEAMHLLRVCCVPKMDYLIQTVRPSLVQEAAATFDAMMMDCAMRKLGLTSLSGRTMERVRAQLEEPLKYGGLGLRSATGSMHNAWLSSHTRTVQHHAEYWKRVIRDPAISVPSILPFHQSAVGQQLERSITEVRKSSDEAKRAFPLEESNAGKEYIKYFTSGLGKSVEVNHYQSKISAAARKQTFNAQMESLQSSDKTRTDYARVLSVTNAYASRWVVASASTDELRLSDHVFCNAVRLRVGLPPDAILEPQICICGAEYTCWHALCCKKCKRTSVTVRHNVVTNLIAQTIRGIGGVACVEPARLDVDTRKRPDIRIVVEGKVLLVDVTIRHPTAASHIDKAQVALGAAKAAEESKLRKYQSMAEHQGARFVAFACETYGAIGESAQRLIAAIGIAADDLLVGGSRASSVRRELVDSISVAIQRGNCFAADECFNRNASPVAA